MSVPPSADRRFEFFIVKKALHKYLDLWRDKTVPLSCEMFASMICGWALKKYDLNECSVTVQEDNENFATYSERLERASNG